MIHVVFKISSKAIICHYRNTDSKKNIDIYITDPKYIEYGIGVVTIFIGHQELELKTTYIESDKFIHRIFFPILKILLGTQRIHQLPHETNRIGAEMEPVRSRIQTGSTFFHLSQERVRHQQARGNERQNKEELLQLLFIM